MQKIDHVFNDIVIQTGASLQEYNTLAVPAQAAFFTRCISLDQLTNSLRFARERALQVLVLGEGSNTVFTRDFEGLLVLNRLTGIDLLNENADNVTVKVAAGESWHDFVLFSLQHGWYGLENLALIPGLVGASPIQNIGAYGVEVKDTISAVHTLDIDSGEISVLSNSECDFSYRDSIFKRALVGKSIVTSVEFELSKTPRVNLSYPALAEHFDHLPSPMAVFKAVCEIRSAKLPMPDDIPNAGSFFKNPIVDQVKYNQLKIDFPSLVAFEIAGGGAKIAAAWLIEQCGWKEKSVDAVYVHRQHALVVVNPNFKHGGAILNLATAIQDDVKAHYGLVLEIEPRVY
jgi:UDP-N-acetylmuramate dehydrogenase